MSSCRLHQAKLAARAWPDVVLALRPWPGEAWRSGSSMPYSRALAQLRQGVVADLVAEAARAAVDHDADHVLFEAHDAGGFLVEDVIDDLHFQEVIPEPSVPHRSSRFSAWSQHVVRVAAVDAPVGFGVNFDNCAATPNPRSMTNF